jgi:hypothetical protein
MLHVGLGDLCHIVNLLLKGLKVPLSCRGFQMLLLHVGEFILIITQQSTNYSITELLAWCSRWLMCESQEQVSMGA